MSAAARLAVGGLALLALAGCGAPEPAPVVPPPSAPARTGLPPRPMTLSIEGIDPCSLLSDEQREGLGVNEGRPDLEGGAFQGTTCSWSNFPKRPSNGWIGGLTTNQGAEFALGKGEPLRFVQGFAATTTGSVGTDPRWYCAMFVDIGPGQSLSVDYDNGAHDYPGMNHELACDKAEMVADWMLSALKARQPR